MFWVEKVSGKFEKSGNKMLTRCFTSSSPARYRFIAKYSQQNNVVSFSSDIVTSLIQEKSLDEKVKAELISKVVREEYNLILFLNKQKESEKLQLLQERSEETLKLVERLSAEKLSLMKEMQEEKDRLNVEKLSLTERLNAEKLSLTERLSAEKLSLMKEMQEEKDRLTKDTQEEKDRFLAKQYQLQTELTRQNAKILKKERNLNLRGAVEYARSILSSRSTNAGNGVKPFEKLLADLTQDKEFQRVLQLYCNEKQFNYADAVRCVKGLYHSLSKQFHSKEGDWDVVIDVSEWSTGEVLAFAALFEHTKIPCTFCREGKDIKFEEL